MTPEQINLVKGTVPVLRESGVALTNYFYARMLAKNPRLKEIFNMGHQRSGDQAKALANAVLAYAENIENLPALSAAVELMAHKHVSLNVQASDYAIVGENLLHSISEVLNISMEDPLIKAWAEAYDQLAKILIATEKEIYDRHQKAQGSWLGWRSFKIHKKEIENNEVTSFYLQPADQGALPSYEAGQYISVRVFVEELGFKQPRQYTLSNNSGSDYLRISVKREDKKGDFSKGWVSNTLHQLPEGSEVEVSAPTGSFYLINPNKHTIFISGGIGITPMIAMLNQLVTLEIPKPATFIHACRNGKAYVMKKHIDELNKKFPHFNMFTVYENPDADDVLNKTYDAAGFLDLNEVDNKLFVDDADYYLCGPKEFIIQQHNALIARGIAIENIHSEVFMTGGVNNI